MKRKIQYEYRFRNERKERDLFWADVFMILINLYLIYEMIKSGHKVWIFIAGFITFILLALIADLITNKRFRFQDENGDFIWG